MSSKKLTPMNIGSGMRSSNMLINFGREYDLLVALEQKGKRRLPLSPLIQAIIILRYQENFDQESILKIRAALYEYFKVCNFDVKTDEDIFALFKQVGGGQS